MIDDIPCLFRLILLQIVSASCKKSVNDKLQLTSLILTDLLRATTGEIDKLQQAGKIDNLTQVSVTLLIVYTRVFSGHDM